MSRYLLPRLSALEPYVPGEQPRNRGLIKLNTNESPFPPSPRVVEALSAEKIAGLNLYPDPTARDLKEAIAKGYGIPAANVFVGNGSDEVLGFAFLAYSGPECPVTIPDISYGLYKVFCRLFGASPRVVPLNPDFTLPAEKFVNAGAMVALANPNAPTAIALPLSQIERIVAGNPNHVVLVDEAYVDFGGETALPLVSRYPNLLIVRTYSKSRSLAGGRLGYALAGPELIKDLERVKNSFHPYSVGSLALAAGIAAMEDQAYFRQCVDSVCRQREETAKALRAQGFSVTDSATNFLFVAPTGMTGETYYQGLKDKGVLVRYFPGERLKAYVRITIGTKEQMAALLEATKELLKEAAL